MDKKILIVMLLLLSCVGCADEFEPRSEILGVRVLGIRASQPALDPGDAVTLEALIASPSNEPVTLRWEACVAPEGAQTLRQCATFEGQPTTIAEGEGEVFSLTYASTFEPLVQQLCECTAALAEQAPDDIPIPSCEQEGYPAHVRLTVEAASLDEPLVATRKLYLRATGDQTPWNAQSVNPAVSSLGLQDAPERLRAGESYEALCEVDAGLIERFYRRSSGPDELVAEQLLFSWFVTGATLERGISFHEEGVIALEDAQKNTLTIKEGVEQVTLWCVLRDGRGGVDWRQVTYPVEP